MSFQGYHCRYPAQFASCLAAEWRYLVSAALVQVRQAQFLLDLADPVLPVGNAVIVIELRAEQRLVQRCAWLGLIVDS